MTRNAFLIERRLCVLALLASVAHSARAETLRVGQWCDRGNRADPGCPHVDRLAAVAGSGAARWNADKAAGKAADNNRVLRFTFSRRQEDPRTQWLIAVYRALLASLGLGFEFLDVPPGRAPLSVQSGQADGELGRTFRYGLLYPDLVRVPEPNNQVEFAAYATAPPLEAEIPGWEIIRARAWNCEYRRGIQELAELLQQKVPPRNVSTVATIEQGIRRLQLGRTDLYFDVREAVADFLAFGDASAAVKSGPQPRMVGIVQRTSGHAYLHRRHASLVPALSEALREMKLKGEVARLREEALQRYLASRSR